MDEGRRRFLEETARCTVIGLDTSACIYYLQEEFPFVDLVEPLIRRAASGSLRIVLSAIVQLELMVRPYQIADAHLLGQVMEFTDRHAGIATRSISQDVVKLSAQVRASLGLKLPDAVIVGTSIEAGAEAIVGNDAGFRRLDGGMLQAALSAVGSIRVPQFVQLDQYV